MKQYTITDATNAISELLTIKKPDADIEGDAINSNEFYNNLSEHDQNKVNRLHHIISDYVKPNGIPDRKAINLLAKKGYSTQLHEGQYSENDELVGQIMLDKENDLFLDLSD